MNALRTILAGGLISGAMDICAAFIVWAMRGASPLRILQGIASGLLGRPAFSGGWRTAALGLALHFLIATTATAVYFLASRKLKAMVERPVLLGAIYGVVVYAFMNFVVLPLSLVTKRPFDPGMAAIMVGVHVLCIGLPIALVVHSAEP